MPQEKKLPTIKELTNLQIKVETDKKWDLVENGDKGSGHYLVNR